MLAACARIAGKTVEITGRRRCYVPAQRSKAVLQAAAVCSERGVQADMAGAAGSEAVAAAQLHYVQVVTQNLQVTQ